MNDKEAMQALIDGKRISKTGYIDILNLTVVGMLVNQNNQYCDFIVSNKADWQIYESREDKIKRLARGLQLRSRKVSATEPIPTHQWFEGDETKELLNLILEDG